MASQHGLKNMIVQLSDDASIRNVFPSVQDYQPTLIKTDYGEVKRGPAFSPLIQLTPSKIYKGTTYIFSCITPMKPEPHHKE